MIKFKVTDDRGRVSLGFGLSERNIELLKQGNPIYVVLDEMGLNASIMIMYGKTEAELIETLKPHIGKDTIVHGT